jgi:hypothetical protein
MGRQGHLSDDRLIEVCLEGELNSAEDLHFAACATCRDRRARLDRMLGELSNAASVEAEAAFPPEKLAAQQARILQRIEQDGRPARVITFPAVPAADIRPLRTRPAGRWIAAAAAAGLAIGLLAGHLAHDLPAFGRPARTTIARSTQAVSNTPTTVHAVNATLNDEEFLGELESALHGPHLAVLRPLNELTPE